MKRLLLLSPILMLLLAACTTAPIVEQVAPQGRIIPVTAELWKFTPNVIQAKQGEEAVLQITGVSGTHGFSVPDLGINATIIQGQTVSVTLPTDRPGTFDFRCSVPCGAGHKDMTGQIIVAP
ncbi:hypothetical protein A2947_03535 [Candidatus Peribacteria bacterium RIFCSPLOWO2_01_FULL_54_110]|nr:MAG: hypothetical protein A2789_03270 [Candidatus Peribacteria bacterium RIFCSPHIGHO2_01_FULL_54_22]OGJ63401.1 MAG: hypothetical protein A3D12_04100 [Candidatus Peribacteria bacterium RIFCSPHIGHO2_02_FULL_55_24]OGJ64983.1 MAG: hypothetical protein A3E47_00640 [Candidatus Peribacteria bacterium RIFCSPHIGHO2_12_FULL_54_10]OGJ67885.1 MAG: hypothetical protein A2947_03535 [Candidatus Peribacteria bacterium RIFCSPLOWO2_01_FULL_54_110]